MTEGTHYEIYEKQRYVRDEDSLAGVEEFLRTNPNDKYTIFKKTSEVVSVPIFRPISSGELVYRYGDKVAEIIRKLLIDRTLIATEEGWKIKS